MKQLLALILVTVLALAGLTATAQSIPGKKSAPQKTEKTTKNSKKTTQSSKSSKSSKTTKQQSSSRSGSTTQAQKDRIIRQAVDNMVWVAGGTFMMGATSEQGSDAESDEKPVHKVTLSDFYISKYEVTQELWQAVMGSNPSEFKGDSRRPVENVSWDDCQEFIRKLNQMTGKHFRLPTEAEWEYAARGGKQSRGYKYAGSNTIGSVAWYNVNTDITTYPVGQKSPNELGLYDMTGNVLEWCQDWEGDYGSGHQTNPQGPSSGSYRVSRGGCWIADANDCRVSFRFSCKQSDTNNFVGLRLAM